MCSGCCGHVHELCQSLSSHYLHTHRIEVGLIDLSPTITIVDRVSVSSSGLLLLLLRHVAECLSTGCRHGFDLLLLCLPFLTA